MNLIESINRSAQVGGIVGILLLPGCPGATPEVPPVEKTKTFEERLREIAIKNGLEYNEENKSLRSFYQGVEYEIMVEIGTKNSFKEVSTEGDGKLPQKVTYLLTSTSELLSQLEEGRLAIPSPANVKNRYIEIDNGKPRVYVKPNGSFAGNQKVSFFDGIGLGEKYIFFIGNNGLSYRFEISNIEKDGQVIDAYIKDGTKIEKYEGEWNAVDRDLIDGGQFFNIEEAPTETSFKLPRSLKYTMLKPSKGFPQQHRNYHARRV